MKIGFVSWTFSRSTERVMEAAAHRGHQPLRLHPAAVPLRFLPGQVEVGWPGGVAPDLLLTRLGGASPAGGLHLVRQAEALGIPAVNSAASLERCQDKVRSFLELSRAGLPVAPTVFLSPAKGEAGPGCVAAVLEALPTPPWVVKLPQGAQGVGVMWADSLRALRSLLDTWVALGQPFLVQADVSTQPPTSLRVLVLEGQAVCAGRRTAPPGDFRTNDALGGATVAVPLTGEARQVAERAVAALGLWYAGVDLVETPRGLVLLEVNSSPGLALLAGLHQLPLEERVVEGLERL